MKLSTINLFLKNVIIIVFGVFIISTVVVSVIGALVWIASRVGLWAVISAVFMLAILLMAAQDTRSQLKQKEKKKY